MWKTLDLDVYDTDELSAREQRLAETEAPVKRHHNRQDPLTGRWEHDERDGPSLDGRTSHHRRPPAPLLGE